VSLALVKEGFTGVIYTVEEFISRVIDTGEAF
jgi:hypothetical protein